MQTKHAPTLSAKTWKILAQISGNKAETVGWIGDWLLSVNLAEPAKEALLQSLRGWESPLVYNDLGDIYYSRKDYSLALNYYKIADEKWEHRRSLRGLGYTYFQLKEYDSSVKYISRYLQMGDSMMAIAPYPLVKANQVYYQDNDRNSALILLAEGYIGEGLTDSAVSVLKQVETNDTNNPDYWIARALEGYIANDFVASGKAIEKALKPKPGLYRNLKEDPFLSEVIISQNIPPFDRNRR
jgi:tetratricopeptide (TPR) repeat protein